MALPMMFGAPASHPGMNPLSDGLNPLVGGPTRPEIQDAGAGADRPSKRKRAEERYGGIGRLCNLLSAEKPAVLEVTQDCIALVNQRSGNVEAANSKFYNILNVLGGDNPMLGQAVMQAHMLEKLQDLPIQDAPFVYEAPLIGVDGVPMFVRGSVVRSADEVVWSLSDVTRLVRIRQSLLTLRDNYAQLLMQSKPQSAAAGLNQQGAPASAAPARSAAPTRKLSQAVVPPGQPSPEVKSAVSSKATHQMLNDWTAWAQPPPLPAAPSKTKTRRPYRFCSKCWLKRGTWALRSVKLPDGCIVNLNRHTNDTCPDWPEEDLPPTAEQTRAYGTAFKRAQRGAHLHEIAIKEFSTLLPGVSEDVLNKHLTG